MTILYRFDIIINVDKTKIKNLKGENNMAKNKVTKTEKAVKTSNPKAEKVVKLLKNYVKANNVTSNDGIIDATELVQSLLAIVGFAKVKKVKSSEEDAIEVTA